MWNKIRGFLIIESLTGLTIAIIGVMTFALIIVQSQKLELNMEYKTDRVYAWHVMRKFKLNKIKVHDHVYELKGNNVYDTKVDQEYKIK